MILDLDLEENPRTLPKMAPRKIFSKYRNAMLNELNAEWDDLNKALWV